MIENLKALAVFAKTVECGSFRGAAQALALSPSVVSHHVSELERRLSLPLLYRSTRHLALTPDGEKLFASAREMLRAAERALDSTATSSSAPTGTLRVTAPAMLAETRFCRDVAAFARAHPQVTLHVGFTEHRRDLLRDRLDVALRIGTLDDSTLTAKRITVMPRVLVASPEYVAARREPRAIGDLEGWDFIQLTSRRPEITLVPRGKKPPVTRRFSPRMIVDTATALREMAVAGLGLTTLPEVLARRDLAQGRLVEVLPAWRLTSPGVFAVWPGGTPRPELTQRFVEFIAARLATLFRSDAAG